MGRKSKKARKIRQASEFNPAQLTSELTPPTTTRNVYTWDIARIRAARDAQLRGDFMEPARMAAAMRTDDALFAAYENRLAPQRAVGVELVPRKGQAAARVAAEAEALFGAEGVGLHPDTLSDINGDLANHGLAVGLNVVVPRPDGSRLDFFMKSWPIEFVRYDTTTRQLMTRIDPYDDNAASTPSTFGGEVPIVHGDGRWVVFQKHEHEPWSQEAALLSAALVWARHAHSVRDWVRGSTSHGNAKVVGKLGEGVALSNKDGTLTTEATGFLSLLRAIANLDSPVGIAPAGAEVDYMTNASRAWQVWSELVLNGEKAAARIYLGTDGMLGSIGGAPGVDIQALFGVATTIVQGDLSAIERGILTGVIEPWAAVNFGDSSLAPTRRYMIPDADADAARDSYAKRSAAFYADIAAARENGFVIDQAYADKLAKQYGIVAPALESNAAPAASLFAYHLDYGILTVNEIRAQLGLEPIAGGDSRPVPAASAPVPPATPPAPGTGAAPRAPVLVSSGRPPIANRGGF